MKAYLILQGVFFKVTWRQSEVKPETTYLNIQSVGWGLPHNYDKQEKQAEIKAAAAVALRLAGCLWIVSEISNSYPGAIIINIVCLRNEY